MRNVNYNKCLGLIESLSMQVGLEYQKSLINFFFF